MATPSSQLFPEVVDATSLIAKPTQNVFLPIGIEGQMNVEGDAVVGQIYPVPTSSEGHTLFGATSSICEIIDAALDGGSSPVFAAASDKATLPTLDDRKAVWDNLASDPNVRLRLTDSAVQADLVALAQSAEDAELVQNKQVAIVGMVPGTNISTLIGAATAIGSTRGVLVAPGVYDRNGDLRDGSYAAAIVASLVSGNDNLADDLDLQPIPLLAAIEKDSLGNPFFRNRVQGGTAINEFETALQGGVSPLAPGQTPGTVEITHLRTTFTSNSAYDALGTRLIVDQLFVDVRDYVKASGFLRRGNTESTRNALAAAVTALLEERSSWLSPIVLANGTVGYGVTVISSADNRQLTVSYQGRVIRGIQTIQIAPVLTIPV